MPRPRYLHIHQQFGRKRANGARKVMWYFRVGHGPRVRLKGEYGSAVFAAHYHALFAAHFGAAPLRHGTNEEPLPHVASEFTLRWLFDEYRRGDAWRALKPSTRSARDRILYAVLQESGGAEVADIDRAAIGRLIDKRRATPHQANHFLKTLRHVFDWAVAEKKIDQNPCDRIKTLKTVADGEEEGHKTWTEDELARFEARWPIGTRERLVYSVLLYTGLRIGDAAKLGHQHVKNGGVLEIKTEKKGVLVYLRILKPLAEALAAGPRGRNGELAFITSSTGRAFVKESLGNWFRDAVRAAGLTERSAHGLRKAAARRVAEAGVSEAGLNALFGWRDPRMAAHYTEQANRRRLALQAIDVLAQDETGTIPSLTPKMWGINS